MADTFGADIAAWAEEAAIQASRSCANKAATLYKRVIVLSPKVGMGEYSIGHFVMNWRLGTQGAVIGEIPGTSNYYEKSNEIDLILDDDYFLNHDMVTMTNSVPYIHKVEYYGWKRKDGSSFPAYAPVAKALAEAQ